MSKFNFIGDSLYSSPKSEIFFFKISNYKVVILSTVIWKNTRPWSHWLI